MPADLPGRVALACRENYASSLPQLAQKLAFLRLRCPQWAHLPRGAPAARSRARRMIVMPAKSKTPRTSTTMNVMGPPGNMYALRNLESTAWSLPRFGDAVSYNPKAELARASYSAVGAVIQPPTDARGVDAGPWTLYDVERNSRIGRLGGTLRRKPYRNRRRALRAKPRPGSHRLSPAARPMAAPE